MPVESCPDCKSEHLGGRCGMTFAERLRTTQVHASVLETRTRERYYDHDSVDEQFGGTAKERREEFYADTRGMGKLKHVEGGALFRDRKSKEVKKISDAQLEREFSVPR